jgi:hypothetical protein
LSVRSVNINDGHDVDISHNLFVTDVSEAVKVSQYTHVNIKCNRKSASQPVLDGCENQPAEIIRPASKAEETKKPLVETDLSVLDDSMESGSSSRPTWWSSWDENHVTPVVLAAVDMAALFWLSAALLLTAAFLLVYLFCRRCRRPRSHRQTENGGESGKSVTAAAEPRGIADLIRATSQLGARLVDTEHSPSGATMPLREADEYSNSSRAHLAQGVEPGPLQYIRVQGVSAEEEEGGVVCGHLTLGPSFAVGDTTSVRTASSNRLKQQTFSKI